MPNPKSKRTSACAVQPSEPLDQLPFDADERGALTVARHYFRSFAAPDTQAWITGIGAALQVFESNRAPALAVATLGAVQTMRCARSSVFQFNDPGCATCAGRITRHEKAWLGALSATRENASERAAGHAVILCEGADHTAFLTAMGILAAHLPPRTGSAPR